VAKLVRWRAKQLRLEMAARLGRDVSQEEIFQATGIAVSTISKIENNVGRGVEFETLQKLCDFYGVSVGEILHYNPKDTDAETNKRAASRSAMVI
jgi:putative transcriptional regulator